MERAELIALASGTDCAERRGDAWFLRDPAWTSAEREAFEMLVKPAATAPLADEGWLCIRTGGSGGGMKFARHDEHTIGAAVRGFCARYQLPRVNALDVLPPHHVSGFMARARCAVTGGQHVAWRWKRLEAGEWPAVQADVPWVISLVPTQLHRLLALGDGAARLRDFHFVFVGGGPVWPELAALAMTARIRVTLTYGMTETAAMVTALSPEDFLAGERSAGPALPHVRISLAADDGIQVEGASVCRGYFPGRWNKQTFLTGDLGSIDSRGHLHVQGRRDAVIITGGKKVQPAEVESVLRSCGEFSDVAVIGVPDPEWGEAVVAFYPATKKLPDIARAVAGLAAHQRPKRFVPVAAWPRNAQGKLNRSELLRLSEPPV